MCSLMQARSFHLHDFLFPPKAAGNIDSENSNSGEVIVS